MFEGQLPPEARKVYADQRRSMLEHRSRPARFAHPGRIRRTVGDRLIRVGTRIAGSDCMSATPMGGPVMGSPTALR